MELLLEKIQVEKNEDLSKIETRVRNKTLYETEKNAPFVEFIERNTRGNETFIDFSNNPMLYFYTRKITPSFFYQNPICSHNDFLQHVFINDLKDYNTPFLVFSRKDESSRDLVDWVPNTLRHYRIAEYIYANFEPYVLAGIFEVWKRKTHKSKNADRLLYSFIKSDQNISPDSLIKTIIPVKPGKKYRMRIALEKKIPLDIHLNSNGSEAKQKYEYITDTLAYVVFEPNGTSCNVSLKSQGIVELKINEYDYIPDFYAEKFNAYSYLKLPYIWGKYDKEFSKEQVLFETTATRVLEPGVFSLISLPENIDKTSGNSIVLTCKNTSKHSQKLTLYFGKNGDKNKTEIEFDVLPSAREEQYVFRVSNIYKWYIDTIQNIRLRTSAPDLTITKIQLTKGL